MQPSLPRVLRLENKLWHTLVEVPPPAGEALAEYTARLGPVPVHVACLLIARLVGEIEALEIYCPEATGRLRPREVVVDLWQGEFLQLRLSTFENQQLSSQQICEEIVFVFALLIGIPSVDAIPPQVCRQLPLSVLEIIRKNTFEFRSLNLNLIKVKMLSAAASLCRDTRRSSLMFKLIVHPRWHPLNSAKLRQPPEIDKSTARNSRAIIVPLSRILAYRQRLKRSECELLAVQIRAALPALAGMNTSLSPENIWIHLPTSRLLPGDMRVLDAQLDEVGAVVVISNQPRSGSSIDHNPIVMSEADELGGDVQDLLDNHEQQLERLMHLSESGYYGLSSFDCDFTTKVESLACMRSRVVARQNHVYWSQRVFLEKSIWNELPSNIQIKEQTERKAKKTMKLILITAGSGGTGKSTVCRMIYELAGLQERNDVALYDCDAVGNRDFQKVAPNKIASMPISDVDTMRSMVECAMSGRMVLADLPASSHEIVAKALKPVIVKSLNEANGLIFMPIHVLTAKSSSLPTIMQWRETVFGESPSVIFICLKDGPVAAEAVDELVRPQDMVLQLPLVDQSLCAALDACRETSWQDILDGKSSGGHRMFGNPLVIHQLKVIRQEFENAFMPLIRRIRRDENVSVHKLPSEPVAKSVP